MSNVQYVGSFNQYQSKTTLQGILNYYGLNAIFEPIKFAPKVTGGEALMKNLTGLSDQQLRNSLQGIKIKNKIGETAAKTGEQMFSLADGLRNASDIISKSLTLFQTIEDYQVKTATGLNIGSNILIVADRVGNSRFGQKFVIVPKGLEVTGKSLQWLSGKGNALGLIITLGTFALERGAGEPVKCSSVFDVAMAAAPVVGSASVFSGGTVGILLVAVSGFYAAADLAHQIVKGESLSKYLDKACEFIANAKPSPPQSYSAQQMAPNSSNLARYFFSNSSGPAPYKFNQ